MSDLHFFCAGEKVTAVNLPHSLDELLTDWQAIRSRMLRKIHPEFTRTEWAYLIQFLAADHLKVTFYDAFGERTVPGRSQFLANPVQKVALWLPNNVSLLGPLTLILLSLTGVELRAKAGSQSQGLCASFVDWLKSECPAGKLKDWLNESIQILTFNRTDLRNAEMAAWADVRIVFGSDAAAGAVEALPHPVSSKGFYFAHKVSEIWMEPSQINEHSAVNIAKVFSVYGQAGCTSPKRVFLIDGTENDAKKLSDELANVWKKTVVDSQPRHTASETLMASQWAKSLGMEAIILGDNSGVAILGGNGEKPIEAHMAIALQWGDLNKALETMPSNIQSIGYALADPYDPIWLNAIATARTPARFVPILEMHHFGSVWDGSFWWQNLFQITALR